MVAYSLFQADWLAISCRNIVSALPGHLLPIAAVASWSPYRINSHLIRSVALLCMLYAAVVMCRRTWSSSWEARRHGRSVDRTAGITDCCRIRLALRPLAFCLLQSLCERVLGQRETDLSLLQSPIVLLLASTNTIEGSRRRDESALQY